MKLLEKIESKERCAEAGWFAYDFIMDEETDKDFILKLRALGSFVFMEMLKKPFYKIESDHYMIKGIMGDPFFRMAVHKDYTEELTKMEEFIHDM